MMLNRPPILRSPDEPDPSGGDAAPSTAETANAVPGAGAPTGGVGGQAPAIDPMDEVLEKLPGEKADPEPEDKQDDGTDDLFSDDELAALIASQPDQPAAQAPAAPAAKVEPTPAPKDEPKPAAIDFTELVSDFPETKPLVDAFEAQAKKIEELEARLAGGKKPEQAKQPEDAAGPSGPDSPQAKAIMSMMDAIPGLNTLKYGDSRTGKVNAQQFQQRVAMEAVAAKVMRGILSDNPIDASLTGPELDAELRRIEAASLALAHRHIERSAPKPESKLTTKSSVLDALRHKSKTRSPSGLSSSRVRVQSDTPFDENDDGPTAMVKVLRARGIQVSE